MSAPRFEALQWPRARARRAADRESDASATAQRLASPPRCPAASSAASARSARAGAPAGGGRRRPSAASICGASPRAAQPRSSLRRGAISAGEARCGCRRAGSSLRPRLRSAVGAALGSRPSGDRRRPAAHRRAGSLRRRRLTAPPPPRASESRLAQVVRRARRFLAAFFAMRSASWGRASAANSAPPRPPASPPSCSATRRAPTAGDLPPAAAPGRLAIAVVPVDPAAGADQWLRQSRRRPSSSPSSSKLADGPGWRAGRANDGRAASPLAGDVDGRALGVAAAALVRPRAGRSPSPLAGAAPSALLCRPLRRLACPASGRTAPRQGVGGEGSPPTTCPGFAKAADEYQLGPRGFSIVAAIHKVESDFGRSPLPGVRSGTNSAGAAGPGQFLFSTWATYGVDANGDGRKDIYSIPDSVFATANYLHASGAPGDWRGGDLRLQPRRVVRRRGARKPPRASARHDVCTARRRPLGELPAGRLARVEYVAKWIEARRIHYCWGGGHAAEARPVARAATAGAPRAIRSSAPPKRALTAPARCAGYWSSPAIPTPARLVSDELAAAYPSGRGTHVTIWSNVDHVFLEIDGRDWGTSDSNFAHGPGYGPQDTEGFFPSHPAGL